MKALEYRKQLLIAESDLNRAQLLYEMQRLEGEIQSFSEQAGKAETIASAVTALVAGLASFRPPKPEPDAGKPSWWQTILQGAGLLKSMWGK